MTVRAAIARHYKLRFLIGAIFLFGFAGWCFYDGYVAWPRDRVIAREYAKFKSEGRTDEWNNYAESKDWPLNTYGDPAKDHTDDLIRLQLIIGYTCSVVGAFFLVGYLRTLSRWVEWDGQRVNTSDGQSVAADAVTKLDKSRWKKCYTVIHYAEPPGRLVLDAWKYEQKTVDEIVAQVESRLKPELVVQPPTDTPTQAATAMPADRAKP